MNPTEKIQYTLPALNVHEQIELLLQKGLLINTTKVAEHWLTHNSYYRFRNYSTTFKDYQSGDYIPNTTFEKVRDLHFFDRKLRMTVFDGIENIEISIKTNISEIMSKAYGPHWYLEPVHFISPEERRKIARNAKYKNEIPTVFNHQKFLHLVKSKLNNHFDPLFTHYKKIYEPIYPPSWMLMEMLTFGTLSRMFENLRPSLEKNLICRAFGLTKKQLVSWLHCFNAIRNKCAHHNKLVYSKVNFAPCIPQKESRKFLQAATEIDPTSLYAVLCCIQYMLNICNNDSQFKADLLGLLHRFPDVRCDRLGFTQNWRTEKIWASPNHLS